MDASIISSIVNGAVSLSSAFIGFGAQVYAIDHTKVPSADINSYNIVLPPTQDNTAVSTEVIMLVVVLVIVMVVIGFLMYKYS